MYRHPNSALGYTCENLWHYMVGLERLKKSHETHPAESRSVNVRQGCCFCSSTFYFKAAPELQTMILFHNIEKEGQIWSVRCAVLSVEFVTETLTAGCHGSVCAVRKMCSVGLWFLAVFKPLASSSSTILLNSLISSGKEPGPSASRVGSSGTQHPGASWWTLTLHKGESQAAEDVSSGPTRLCLGLICSWHHPVQRNHRAEEPLWSSGSGEALGTGPWWCS